MIFLADLSQEQLQEVNKLIDSGRYKDVSQFISTAVVNQIYIEKSRHISNDGGIGKTGVHLSNKTDQIIANGYRKIMLSEISSNPQTVLMPDFTDLSDSLDESDEDYLWLWGQVNKILPVKIGLRVLYAIIGSQQGIDLEKFRNQAADIAAGLGRIIKIDEDKKDIIRDRRISTGLPFNKEFKSILRYKSHFLAYLRKDKKFEGAMPFLRFAHLSLNEKGKVLVGLTEPGLGFAKLGNPVIDKQDFTKSLSDEEIDFYLDHITKNVRAESNAMKWLLNSILRGINEREGINTELKKEYNKFWNVSDAVINTQRAGLMSRMYELGLIDKEKKGVAVEYKVSSRGKIFIETVI